jgi:shikimate kinase
VQKRNARLLGTGDIPTVFLDAAVEELWRRCQERGEQQGTQRPLLGSPKNFRELYEMRKPHYLKASFRQETGGKTVERIAAELVQALGLNRRRRR